MFDGRDMVGPLKNAHFDFLSLFTEENFFSREELTITFTSDARNQGSLSAQRERLLSHLPSLCAELERSCYFLMVLRSLLKTMLDEQIAH